MQSNPKLRFSFSSPQMMPLNLMSSADFSSALAHQATLSFCQAFPAPENQKPLCICHGLGSASSVGTAVLELTLKVFRNEEN